MMESEWFLVSLAAAGKEKDHKKCTFCCLFLFLLTLIITMCCLEISFTYLMKRVLKRVERGAKRIAR